ncbi:MAG: hypothetical protein H8K04_04385 [Nitrospira sp.]
MRQKHVLTALAIFAVTGAVNHSDSLAEGWQGETLIHKVADAYSGMSGPGVMRPDAASSPQGSMPSDQSKYGSPSNETRYGTKSSDPSSQKESSGTPTSPYSESIYGGVPTTPSADPAVRELNRDPSMR